MVKAKKYNLAGEELGELELNDSLLEAKANPQSIKDYIVAIRANLRQWSACTRDRSEVNHSSKKPHPQKKTGRARQGSLAAPQYKGGGVVFGPKPKFNQHVRINRKERRQAIRHLLAEKLRENKLIVLESTEMDAPKTQKVNNFLQVAGLQGRVLFLGEQAFATLEMPVFASKEENDEPVQVGSIEETICVKASQHENFSKSVKNLPKVEFGLFANVNAYDLMLANHLVITEAALAELTSDEEVAA